MGGVINCCKRRRPGDNGLADSIKGQSFLPSNEDSSWDAKQDLNGGATSSCSVEHVEHHVERLGDLARQSFGRTGGSAGRTADCLNSLEASLNFVRAIVRGLASSGLVRDVIVLHDDDEDGASLTASLNVWSASGEIATRSRVPWGVKIEKQGVTFRLSRRPPADSTPFRCRCHARCTAVASDHLDGWAELSVDAGGKRRKFHALTPVVVQEGSLAAFSNAEIVSLAFGDAGKMTAAQVSGKVALVGLGDGEVSKETIVNQAHKAGAIAVIAYNERMPEMFPLVERQILGVSPVLVMIRQEDGRSLAAQAKQGQRLRCIGVWDASAEEEADLRAAQEAQLRDAPTSAVWLHMRGLLLQPASGSQELWEATGRSDIRAFTPEKLWDTWLKNKADWVNRFKLARIFGSGLDKVGTFVPKSRAEQVLGQAMMMSMALGDHQLAWLRFQPHGKKAIGVYGSMRPLNRGGSSELQCGSLGGDSTISEADVNRALRYMQIKIAANPNFKRFGGSVIASLHAWMWCFTGEASGLPPADAKRFTKLFTACNGPAPATSGLPWQRNDRTWNVTDSRTWTGELIEQGRMLWEGSDQEMENGNGQTPSQLRSRKNGKSNHESCTSCFSFLGRGAK
eukprot:TRINITY_DN83426_c0_g1_i1.p1 TRINITY_DN83426_c0_g1~~TRINITY_DN83426_c0_g1_i1.p1  ORF type:complete len:624 (+),score=129.94 TRINITY_DN83426_c0_g1_i1:65-1936(+)